MIGKGLGALETFLRRAAAGTGKIRGMTVEQLLGAAGDKAMQGGRALKGAVAANPGSSAALAGGGALAGAEMGGDDLDQLGPDEIEELMRRYQGGGR